MEFLKHRLQNGLEIVAEVNGNAHSLALGFLVQAGSRDETDALAGVSHFLEHMAFKGTATRSADDINRQFDEIGADYNAYTGEENTFYYAAVLPEYQAPAVALLADILRPALRDEDFETEKQVILEEIQMYEDQPPFGADEKCKAAYFGRHPLGRSVLGTIESVGSLPVDAMRGYWRQRYSPGNILLTATGRVDFDALVAAVERLAGAWEPQATHRASEPAAPGQGFLAMPKDSATQQYVMGMTDGPSARDPGRYPAKLLATILGDDSGSRLYWELVDTGLAEQAALSHYEYEDAGAFMLSMCCEPEDTSENLQRVFDVCRQAEEEGVLAEEVEQAKNKVRSRLVLAGERPRGRLYAVAADWVYRREYRTVDDDLAAVAAIGPADVAAVLARYSLTRATLVSVGPQTDVAPPATASHPHRS